VLGPEKFGLIAFTQAFIQYFNILTDYGFNLSATREIAIYKENKDKVSEILSSVMFIKICLLLLSFVIMSIVVFSFEKFRQDWLIYYLTFGMVVGQVLFPIWFFQGMEKMKYITFLNILAKLVFTVAIFIFIHKASDYIYVPLINSLGSIVVGVLALWMVSKYFDVRFIKPTIQSIKYHLKEGWHIFVSTVAISLYTISNTFILGLFTDNKTVGYYVAAEKIIKTVQGLLSPISQAVFPYISKFSNESKERSIEVVKKLVKVIGILTFFLSVILFIFAESIVNMLLGNQYQESIVVLRILSFLPFIIALSNIYAVQGLISLGSSKVIPKIVFSGASLNIFALPVLTYFYKDVGTAISCVLTEIFITFLSFKYFRRLYHHDWKAKKIY
jgi:PST family polysaccharide transporter